MLWGRGTWSPWCSPDSHLGGLMGFCLSSIRFQTTALGTSSAPPQPSGQKQHDPLPGITQVSTSVPHCFQPLLCAFTGEVGRSPRVIKPHKSTSRVGHIGITTHLLCPGACISLPGLVLGSQCTQLTGSCAACLGRALGKKVQHRFWMRRNIFTS